MLDLQDLTVPKDLYEDCINRKKADEQSLKTEKDIKRNKNIITFLSEEQKDQTESQLRIMEFLKSKLHSFFEKIEDEGGVSVFLVQYCLFPRMMFSPTDALYSINFLKLLVQLKVPKINVLNICAQIIKGIIPTIHSCTNNESENLGIFFMEWFYMIDRWTNKEIWKKECSDYSGFSQVVGNPTNIVSYEYYLRKIVEPIHTRFSQFLRVCFQNPKEQMMKTRAAMKILFRIKSVFPKQRAIAEPIMDELNKIIAMKDQISQDIYTLAHGYHKELTKLFPKPKVVE